MYTHLIQNLKPRPKFNLKWYKNEDLYSEGEIEDLIIKLIAENKPEEYIQAIYDNFNWSTYYHLTNLRKNILNWYPFDKNSNILEIGCGLGAITNILCDNCKEVTAIELSKKRAIATLLRCREKENLEIIVGNINDICFEKKFDYITLIGVLEYQGSYTQTENPYQDFLKKIKGLLKPNGKLLIAIENQYGLKYWCGAREDHTGVPFDGINQYKITKNKVKTFSKAALDELIKQSGFQNTYFYYPMPDYKLPTVIYSQDYLPKNENMQNMACYYVPDITTLIAQEKNIYKDIIENDVFEFFANSFLVECTDSGTLGEVTFANISSERNPEYQIGTRFLKNDKVEKFPLIKESGKGHILQILENERALLERGMNIWKSVWNDQKLVLEYADAPLYEDYFLDACRRKDATRIYEMLDRLYDEIIKSSEEAKWEENILYTLNLGIEPDQDKYGPILKSGYLDMTFRNVFLIEDKLYWFDQEWMLYNIPAKYILFRALTEFYSSFPDVNEVFPLQQIFERYQIFPVFQDFATLERIFIGTVMGKEHLEENGVFRTDGREIYQNIIRNYLKDKC